MPKRQKQVSLDEHTIEQVQRLATEREWSWSKTAGRCIELGLVDAQPAEVADLVTAARDASAMFDFLLFASNGTVEDGDVLRAALRPFDGEAVDGD